MAYDFTPNFGEIGRRIRKLREERHLTQEALSENAGVSVPYVSHIERGIKTPSRPGSGDGTVGALGPAGTERQHSPALGRPADAVGLGGDEALVVDGQQKECLNELGLTGLGPAGHYRLPGEDGRTLGDGPDIA